MPKHLIPLVIFIFLCGSVSAQSLSKAADGAFVITRMAEKFHVSPRPLDDTFSINVFNTVLKLLDPRSVVFTAKDLQMLDKFKFDIDDQIKNREVTFLLAVSDIAKKRIASIEATLNTISEKDFDFSLPEKISRSALETPPADEEQQQMRIYKIVKARILSRVLENNRLVSFTPTDQLKYADSIQKTIRVKTAGRLASDLISSFQDIDGVEQAVGQKYCEAVALCYDPHSAYFSLSKKENFQSELGQRKLVFGFQFSEDNDGVKVEKVLPGSPAYRSGQINKGDKIRTVQWGDQKPIDVSNSGMKQLFDVLAMSNHDRATFGIQKPDGTQRAVVLFKEEAAEDDDNKVKSFILKGEKTVGFISLPAFYQDWESENAAVNGCANDVAKEILKLKKENIEGLIVDLRYNGGGSMQEAVDLAGIFIDAGPVGAYKDRDGKVFWLKDINRGTMYDGPLLIMVNGYTASAAEMVAGTLQDYNRALIVGSQTYGKATAQIILPMDTTVSFDADFREKDADGYLKLTLSELFRVTGQTAQATGVHPDILLPEVLGTNSEREENEPLALKTLPIEPNKYFTPLASLPLKMMQDVGKHKMDSSAFFRRLISFNQNLKTELPDRELSLRLPDAISDATSDNADPRMEEAPDKEQPPFLAVNNLFERQRTLGNERLKALDEQWIYLLSRDPYLRVAYSIILLMK